MLNGSKDPERLKQAVILAAGRGSRLVPYTDALPTALISIGGKSMVAHTISTLRRQGVESFYLCRGWKGDVFDEHLTSLGDGVQLIDCPDFATTGMLESLRVALPHVRPGPLLVCYGDIIFRHSVARQLLETTGGIAAVVNAAAPGKESKGFNEARQGDPASLWVGTLNGILWAVQVEVVAASGSGPDRAIRRIGKGRRVSECDCAGEFAGHTVCRLVKFSTSGRGIMEEVVRRLFQEDKSCTGQAWSLPWWLEPVGRASLCDLLQLMADEGICISLAMVFGGWHEVNTPPDLTRAWNDTALFLSEEDTVTQVKAMGACLLSEANDLKRPLPIVAKELNVNLERLECLLKGNLEVSDALDIMRKMSEVYAVPLNDLWLDADDTDAGVRVFTMEASESSARILDRKEPAPYGHIGVHEIHRVVLQDRHLMMQTTLFIGPVDFYYTDSYPPRAALFVLALAACGLWSAFVGPTKRAARVDRVALEASRKFIVGGNWKANGSPDTVKKLVKDLNDGDITAKDVEVVCAPPFVFLSEVQGSLRKDFAVAAQNLWDKDPGAWTGEIPAQMLADMGIKWVVLGHSERRENCGETSQIVAEKTKFAVDNGFSTLTCIGEKLDAREGGKTFEVLDEQLKPLADVLSEEDWEKVVLAYEPVWAIGTGKVATPEQAEETHAYIRKWLTDNVSEKVSDSVRIQYGGSVNDKNAADLGQQPNIDGFLVGGASLKGVTYGGAVRRAFTELSRVGAKQVAALAGDSRNPEEARECVLKRCLAAECLSPAELVSALAPGVAEGRAWELLRGAEASSNEIQSLADVLNVRVSDLLVSPLEDEEEVVVTYAKKSQQHARRMNGYVLFPGARTRHQPDLKTFDMEVLESATPGESLSCGLHTFVYHFGSEAVELRWSTRLGASRATILRPGDSSYIAPLVEHSFSVIPGAAQEPGMNGAACGKGRRLFLVRIPGQLSGETLAEFATFSTHGRERVGAETVQWYN
ncbi:TPIP1 [Symbiodinium microadriaticum]|nr:TPIP1 [Symbiodinium microadriaticum]